MKDGLDGSTYNTDDYDRLRAIADAKRQESGIIGRKVQRTLLAAKATKENSVLQQHRNVWSSERVRLAQAEAKAESDLHGFLGRITAASSTDSDIFSLLDHGVRVHTEQEAFRLATVEPVLQLRDDLRYRLSGVLHRGVVLPPSDWLQIEQQVNLVKDQQEDISEKLEAEGLALEEDIAALGLEDHLICTPGTLAETEAVPAEVLDSDCPYPALKDSLVQAFHSLTERYQSKLQSVTERLQGMDRCCGWCEGDHLRFQLAVTQYVHGTPNRRALYMDMLQRLFPQKNRRELTEHEQAWDWQRLTQAQLRTLTQGWRRDHAELLARALVTLQEAKQAHQEELDLHQDRQHQHDICTRLRDKLQQWRAQQEEVLRLEAAIAASRQEEEEERLRREQERETAIRSQQREKLREFHLKQQQQRELREKHDLERVAQLRSAMEVQARRDKERVQFREEILQRRRQEREALELERQKAAEERQNRLEALASQVGVVAEADPLRMMGDTQAWKSRQENNSGQFEPRKPLYSINTFTDTQIVSDPRVRVERALREAGLHHSQYAQQILATIKPPKPPRRDTISVVLKSYLPESNQTNPKV